MPSAWHPEHGRGSAQPCRIVSLALASAWEDSRPLKLSPWGGTTSPYPFWAPCTVKARGLPEKGERDTIWGVRKSWASCGLILKMQCWLSLKWRHQPDAHPTCPLPSLPTRSMLFPIPCQACVIIDSCPASPKQGLSYIHARVPQSTCRVASECQGAPPILLTPGYLQFHSVYPE